MLPNKPHMISYFVEQHLKTEDHTIYERKKWRLSTCVYVNFQFEETGQKTFPSHIDGTYSVSTRPKKNFGKMLHKRVQAINKTLTLIMRQTLIPTTIPC